MHSDSNQARKALVAVSIETVLHKMGKTVYDQVVYRLYEEYHCYLPDCYENPEYLKRVLQDLYGRSASTIIELIKKQLEEFREEKEIDRFVTIISV